MSYLTVSEFRERVPARDLTGLLGDVTLSADQDALIAACIAEAEQTLEGYASARYPTPLTATAQVAGITFRLALFALVRRKRWNFSDAQAEDEKSLLRQLEGIPARKFNLVSQTELGSTNRATSVRENDPAVRTTGRRREFDDTGLKGF